MIKEKKIGIRTKSKKQKRKKTNLKKQKRNRKESKKQLFREKERSGLTMQSDGSIIFVGIKISEKLRDYLDNSKTSMKPFFANNDSKFLQVLQIDGDDYIAKTIESGVSLVDLNNMFMNLKTMLKMICPDFSFTDAAIKIYAHTPTQMRTDY